MSTPVSRPKYLNLLRIKMPVGAVASIAHRISGVLLFLSIPLLVYLLELSLRGPEGFAQVLEFFASPLMKLLSVLLVWGLVHHLLAGLRFLCLDLQIGMERASARNTAWVVNLGGLLGVLAYIGWLL